MLSNVRSLENKLDLIQLSRSTQHEARYCCVFVFTETWLNDNILDSAIQLNMLTCYRADRDTALSGKTRGGGLCMYINKEWCNNAAVLSKHCSSLVEFMFVKCRPFYLPREFTAIVIVAVYIPPRANAKDALRELYSAISEQQTNNPDGFFIIAGDFNHANLKTVLPKFYQHVNFATRGNNTLDFVYTTEKNAYKAVPRPHLGYSDHISVMLIPAYRPLLKLAKPVQKLITIWPENATSTLQDCFQCTDWNMFKEAATYNNHTDLQEYTETVTAYIKKCIDDVTVTKTITARANQKSWMTAEVRGLLKTRDEAFRSGDKAALKTARANLSCGIKNAKRSYAQKINNHFTDSRDTRSLWQAIQTITDYKPPPQACDDTSLPDALNHFYSWFEMQNDTPAQKLPTPPNDQALYLSPADVRKTLSRINPRKAAGPDNISGRVLKDCAAQLMDVLTDIFNTSLSQAVVPTCLKSTTIIPVPKKSPVSWLNDYRPIALTPIMMKCFERLVMHKIKTSLPNTLDLLQFAYRPNRSMDDAISSTLHLALTHLENKDSYVRMLFIDFSSAFNTIIPQQLINKLNLLGLNNSLFNWILDFLTGRPQSVRVGHNTSSTTTLSTGAPQGCVLRPLLFTLLTHDCTAKFSSNHIIKFADDATVVGLISNNDETHYREEVAQLAEWCGTNNLSLNLGKTKEVVLDFRRRNSIDHPPLTIDSSTVERVSSTKFLGVHITEDLTWTTNTMSLSKKGQQRLHFLRRLKRTSLPPPILTTFYRGTIESVLTSCITVWYGNCSAADRKTLQRTVNTAAKIIVPLFHPSWTFSLHDAPAKPTASWRTPPIPPTVSSSSCHQEDGTEASEPTPPDCSTAFSPRLWEPWTQITPPPLWNPMQTPTSWNMDHPPAPLQTPPNLTTPKKKKQKLYETFLCNSMCATHRWVGLYKPPVVTHSPLCTLDTFHTLLCVHNPTKDSITYVCLHAHALQIILHCSPASCLTHNVSLCTCTVFMWSIRIVCIFF